MATPAIAPAHGLDDCPGDFIRLPKMAAMKKIMTASTILISQSRMLSFMFFLCSLVCVCRDTFELI